MKKNFHSAQSVSPSPGPTLEIEVAAPDIEVIKSRAS